MPLEHVSGVCQPEGAPDLVGGRGLAVAWVSHVIAQRAEVQVRLLRQEEDLGRAAARDDAIAAGPEAAYGSQQRALPHAAMARYQQRLAAPDGQVQAGDQGCAAPDRGVQSQPVDPQADAAALQVVRLLLLQLAETDGAHLPRLQHTRTQGLLLVVGEAGVLVVRTRLVAAVARARVVAVFRLAWSAGLRCRVLHAQQVPELLHASGLRADRGQGVELVAEVLQSVREVAEKHHRLRDLAVRNIPIQI
mmetsp:Transcript_105534/g.315224  ORF Transcript_105534/g.315224 Transcript_105534/m.315224 type:complete len:248 (-) Transcript_105534:223-966(-)